MPSIHCNLSLQFALEVLPSVPVEGTIYPLKKRAFHISEAQISVKLCVVFEVGVLQRSAAAVPLHSPGICFACCLFCFLFKTDVGICEFGQKHIDCLKINAKGSSLQFYHCCITKCITWCSVVPSLLKNTYLSCFWSIVWIMCCSEGLIFLPWIQKWGFLTPFKLQS